ncbi:hypothetical protein F5884DRAFT_670350 [Xylogone sp. PMI_703]|nr:hypothetical protein F5884DRAFT_670350 [Xylogone sp. PMI_703]
MPRNPSSLSSREFQGQCSVFDVEDDWSRVSNPDARRKLQNRLNQRACRSRKKKSYQSTVTSPYNSTTEPSSSASLISHRKSIGTTQVDQATPDMNLLAGTAGPRENRNENRLQMETGDEAQAFRRGSVNKSLTYPHSMTTSGPWYTNRSTILLQFYELQLARYVSRSLSNSHLLSLLQFNVLQGFEKILDILGVPPGQIVDDDAVSPFNSGMTGPSTSSGELVPCFPKALSPSVLQKTVSHHPWVDILPFPQMRDNVLRIKLKENAGVDVPEFDEEELCQWMVGLYPQQGEGGLVLWGEPWDPASWEASEDFIHRWGWILKGCEDLMRSTNYWRRKRGESPLFKVS